MSTELGSTRPSFFALLSVYTDLTLCIEISNLKISFWITQVTSHYVILGYVKWT